MRPGIVAVREMPCKKALSYVSPRSRGRRSCRPARHRCGRSGGTESRPRFSGTCGFNGRSGRRSDRSRGAATRTRLAGRRWPTATATNCATASASSPSTSPAAMLPLPFARPFSIASSTSALGGRSSSRFGPTRAVAFAAASVWQFLQRWLNSSRPCSWSLRERLHVGLGDRVARSSRSRSPRRARRCRAAGSSSTNSSVAPRRPRRLWVCDPLLARPWVHRSSRRRARPAPSRTNSSTNASTAIGRTLSVWRRRVGRGLTGAVRPRSSGPPERRRGSRPCAVGGDLAGRSAAASAGTGSGAAATLRSGSGTTSAPPLPGAASARSSRTKTLIAPPAIGSFSSRPSASSSGSERTISRWRS